MSFRSWTMWIMSLALLIVPVNARAQRFGWRNPNVGSLPEGEFIHVLVDTRGNIYFQQPRRDLLPAIRRAQHYDLLLRVLGGDFDGALDAVAAGDFMAGGVVLKRIGGRLQGVIAPGSSFQSGSVNEAHGEGGMLPLAKRLPLLRAVSRGMGIPLFDASDPRYAREVGYTDGQHATLEQRALLHGGPAFRQLVKG